MKVIRRCKRASVIDLVFGKKAGKLDVLRERELRKNVKVKRAFRFVISKKPKWFSR